MYFLAKLGVETGDWKQWNNNAMLVTETSPQQSPIERGN